MDTHSMFLFITKIIMNLSLIALNIYYNLIKPNQYITKFKSFCRFLLKTYYNNNFDVLVYNSKFLIF